MMTSYDFGCLESEKLMSQVKGLCVMDVDGTLILEEVIDLLGREAGCEGGNFADYKSGNARRVRL